MKKLWCALGAAALLAIGGCDQSPPSARSTLPPGIGDVEIVVRVVHGTLANHDMRRMLTVADAVYWRELIETEQESATEVQFVDGTKLTVGPDAKVNLDEFVYGGPPGTDRMVMTMTKGMSRFVTGSMDKAAYEIRAPGAIIGVRGTEFTLVVDPDDESTVCVVHQGEVELKRPDGGDVVILRPGEASKASTRSSGSITPAAPPSPEVVRTTETLRAVVDEAKEAKKASSTRERVTDAADPAQRLGRNDFGRDRLQELAQRLRMNGGRDEASGSDHGSVSHAVAKTTASGVSPIGAASAVKSSPGSAGEGDEASTVTSNEASATGASGTSATVTSTSTEATAASIAAAGTTATPHGSGTVTPTETSTTVNATPSPSSSESGNCTSGDCGGVSVPLTDTRRDQELSPTRTHS